MKFVMTMSLLAAGLALAGSLQAQDMGDAKRGRALAEGVCAECHAIEKGATRSRNGNAPAFETLARTRGMTPLALLVALRSPHREMPNLVLKGQEIDDIYAYVSTLK
jgi:mono/diheme cytochrome c family protein